MPLELKQDQLNIIDLTEIGVSLEAIADKIIILVDPYTSGYECKNCQGTGKVASKVVEGATSTCDDCKGKGKTLEIPQSAQSMPSTGVIVSCGPNTRAGILIADIKELKRQKDLKENQGLDFWDEIYDVQRKLDNCMIQVGVRVIFGTHVGTKIPVRGNIKLTIMKETDPLCRIFGSTVADSAILDYTADVV